MIAGRRPLPFLLALVLLLAAAPGPAGATWLMPDPTFQEATTDLRLAVRDTAGRTGDFARLDTLGAALLRLGRQTDAEKVFHQVLALAPRDPTASAGLGKLALFHGRLAEAESLLALAAPDDRGALADRMSARLRSGEWAAAAELAPDAGAEGRVALLQSLATNGAWKITGDHADLLWKRTFPVPLVRVKLNGQTVLMAIDTGTGDLLVDQSAARRCNVATVAGQSLAFWNGARVAVRSALVQRLEIGGVKIEQMPAGILALRKWSNEINPMDEAVVGVIGLSVLERFTPTLDYAKRKLELRPRAAGPQAVAGAARIPFEIWGESELTVYGSLAAGRRMALVLASGLPGAGIGAPSEVLDEIGVKPGGVAKIMKGMGGFMGGRSWYEVGVPTVVVGPIARDKVPGWSGALDPSEMWRHGVRRDALLGGEFFRDRRVTIDWAKQELVVEEPR